MKPQQRWTMILTGALLFCTQLIQAQESQGKFRELIVQLPGIVSTRGFPDIKIKLSGIQGVAIVAFCETQHLVMMKLEKKILPDNRPVYDAISEAGFKFNVKEGATISDAKKNCKDRKLTAFSDPELLTE